MKAVAIAAATCGLILIGSLAAAEPPLDPLHEGPAVSASIERGRGIVLRNCAMCHAAGTSGDSPDPQAPRFRDLNARYDVELLAESLAEGIRTHPAMPEFRFEEAEVDDIVAYLRSIQVRQVAGAGGQAATVHNGAGASAPP